MNKTTEELVKRFEKDWGDGKLKGKNHNGTWYANYDLVLNWLRTNLKPLKVLDADSFREMLKKYPIETLLQEQLIVETTSTFGTRDIVLPEKKEVCKDCDGYGWTSEHAGPEEHTEDGECMQGCPIQEQCATCQSKDDREFVGFNQAIDLCQQAIERSGE